MQIVEFGSVHDRAVAELVRLLAAYSIEFVFAKKAAVEAKVTEAVDKLKTVLQAKAVDSVPGMTVSSMPSQEAEIETENQHQDFLDSEVEAKKSDVKKEPGDTETKHKGSSKQKKN